MQSGISIVLQSLCKENHDIEVSFFHKQFSSFFDAEGSIKISDLAQCVFTIIYEIFADLNSNLQLKRAPKDINADTNMMCVLSNSQLRLSQSKNIGQNLGNLPPLRAYLKKEFAYLQEIYNYLRDSLKKLLLCQNIIVVKEGLALDSWSQIFADIKSNLQEQRDNCTSLNEMLQDKDLGPLADDIFNDSKKILDDQAAQMLFIESGENYVLKLMGIYSQYLSFSMEPSMEPWKG